MLPTNLNKPTLQFVVASPLQVSDRTDNAKRRILIHFSFHQDPYRYSCPSSRGRCERESHFHSQPSYSALAQANSTSPPPPSAAPSIRDQTQGTSAPVRAM